MTATVERKPNSTVKKPYLKFETVETLVPSVEQHRKEWQSPDKVWTILKNESQSSARKVSHTELIANGNVDTWTVMDTVHISYTNSQAEECTIHMQSLWERRGRYEKVTVSYSTQNDGIAIISRIPITPEDFKLPLEDFSKICDEEIKAFNLRSESEFPKQINVVSTARAFDTQVDHRFVSRRPILVTR